MRRIFDEPRKMANARLPLRAASIGVIAGTGSAPFRLLTNNLPRVVWTENTDMVLAVGQSPWWARLPIPSLGALLAGLVLMLVARWSGAARGWDILEVVVLRDGILHLRSTLVRCASSLIPVASAGAIGRESPIVLFASTIAWLGILRGLAAVLFLQALRASPGGGIG